MANEGSDQVPNMAPIHELGVLQRLALRARQARQRKQWSQPEMARRSGVALRTYKRFERDGNGSIETLVKVVYALERTVAIELLFQAEVKLETMQDKVARLRQLAGERK